MSVIGIDFGTQYCVIAQAKRGGVETLNNEASKRTNEALVSFLGENRFLAAAAVSHVNSNYKNTVTMIKRFVGKSWSDPAVQNDLAFVANRGAFREVGKDEIGIVVHYQDEEMVLSPVAVCAMLIGSLKNTAVFANDGRPVSDIVFSVPAAWTDRQRRAFLAAAKVAGVDVLGLINDGTATALSYGIWKSAGNQFSADKPEHVMFVDMGYAHFQVTIVAYVQGKLTVVASASDASLGGRDLDLALSKHFAKAFLAKHKGKADPMTLPKSFLKLMGNCEKLKQTLTPEGVPAANLNIEFLVDEIDYKDQITFEQFNEIIDPVVQRLQEPLERAMEESGLTMDKIASVEIVGGSTRVRAIKKRIAEILGLNTALPNYGLSTTMNADESSARGCALRCAMLSPAFRVKEFIVADVLSYPINVSWEQTDATQQPPVAPGSGSGSGSSSMEVDGDEEGGAGRTVGENTIMLFEKRCEVPKTRRIGFNRSAAFEIEAAYAPEVRALFGSDKDMVIGNFRVSELLPPTGESPPRIRVDFKQDEFGLFRVLKAEQMQEVLDDAANANAKEGKKEEAAAAAEGKAAEGEKKKKFKPIKVKVEAVFNGGLSENEILEMREREQAFCDKDKLLAETSAMKNKVESYIYTMRDKIEGELKPFGTAKEFEELLAALQSAEDWLYNDGYDVAKKEYQDRFAQLDEVGGKFARRAKEHEERPAAAAKLRDEIAAALRVVNSPDEQYDHIDDAERDKVRAACEDAEKWLKKQLDLQAETPDHKEPRVTVLDMQERQKQLSNICRPVLTKKRPAPKPKEEKKEEEKVPEQKGASPAGSPKAKPHGSPKAAPRKEEEEDDDDGSSSASKGSMDVD